MDGQPISARAIGHAGLGMLTSDIGVTRLVEILHPRADPRADEVEAQDPARAGRTDAARATRP